MISPLPHGRFGNYELLGLLGSGGMADVYLARHVAIPDRMVALKILSASRVGDDDAHALLRAEVHVTQLCAHPSIPAVLDTGIADERPFVVLEHVDGCDLRELLTATAAPLSFDAAVAIVVAAAAGLDHAHHRLDHDGAPLGLVHRDVSLSNVMVDRDGAVKVIDFGIASTRRRPATAATGRVRGKASYMAPEQCAGEVVDARADVFALGVVLYELACGTPCFVGNSDHERMLATVRGDYVSPRQVRADLPADLEAVIAIALATDSSERFASCAAFANALASVARRHGWHLGAASVARAIDAALSGTGEPRPLARGTLAGIFVKPSPWRCDTDELPTRGHRALRHAA
jgi:serine/threonine protein kinase